MRLLMIPVALLLAGCGTKTPDPQAKPGDQPIEFKPVTVKQLDEYIATQKGKVVLIDCWSIS